MLVIFELKKLPHLLYFNEVIWRIHCGVGVRKDNITGNVPCEKSRVMWYFTELDGGES